MEKLHLVYHFTPTCISADPQGKATCNLMTIGTIVTTHHVAECVIVATHNVDQAVILLTPCPDVTSITVIQERGVNNSTRI